MQQIFLMLAFVACFIFQCFITYNAMTLADCKVKYLNSVNVFEIPREYIEIFSKMIVISLPLFLLFQYFKRQQLQCIQMYITSLHYIIINGYIAGYGFVLMHKIIEIQSFKFVNPTYSNCDVVNQQYSIQLAMLVIWQIIFAFIHLKFNRKLGSMVQLFGKLGFLVRLFFIDVSLTCLTYAIYLLDIQKIIIESDQKDQDNRLGFGNLEFGYLWFLHILLLLIILYLIRLQLQEVFKIYGVLGAKNKTIKIFIWLTLISSLLLIFSPFLYQNFILIYLIIQLNSYQRFDIKQRFNIIQNVDQPILQTDIISCLECQEQINFNDQIIYLDNSIHIFHHYCFQIWKQQQNQLDTYYSIDLRTQMTDKDKCDKMDVYLFYLINWIYTYYIVMDHDGHNIQDIYLMDIIYAQTFLLISFLLFSKMKQHILSFLIFIILCCSQFFHLPIIYFIYQESVDNYLDTDAKFDLDYFANVTKFFIYLVIITSIQAYQFSTIINFQRIKRKYLMVGFVFFTLMNIYSIIFSITKFQDSYFNYLVMTIFLLNLFFLTCYFFNVRQNIEQYKSISNNLIIIKTIVILLIFIIIIVLNDEYKQVWAFLPNYQDLQYMGQKFKEVQDGSDVRLAYLILNIQSIFFLLGLFQKETIFLIECQSTPFSDTQFRQLLTQVNIRQANLHCSSCQSNFQSGQVIIFHIECNHFIHKQCIKFNWINYPWGCEDAGTRYIEIKIK